MHVVSSLLEETVAVTDRPIVVYLLVAPVIAVNAQEGPPSALLS